MKWVISDADIPSFVKILKSMAKIGNELHLETDNEVNLKLQTVNPAHSVHFELILREEFFIDCEPSQDTQTRFVQFFRLGLIVVVILMSFVNLVSSIFMPFSIPKFRHEDLLKKFMSLLFIS